MSWKKNIVGYADIQKYYTLLMIPEYQLQIKQQIRYYNHIYQGLA